MGTEQAFRPEPENVAVRLLRAALRRHEDARHDLLPADDPEVAVCVWCQS